MNAILQNIERKRAATAFKLIIKIKVLKQFINLLGINPFHGLISIAIG
jgi:hypothetical protein